MIPKNRLKVKVWGWIAVGLIAFYAVGIPWVLASEASESADMEVEVPTEITLPTEAEPEPVIETEVQTGDGVSVSSGVTEVNTTMIGESELAVEIITPESSQSAVSLPELGVGGVGTGSAEEKADELRATEVRITNEASVSATVEASAQTGEVKQVSESGNTEARSGQAIAIASNVTLVNTTLVNSELWVGTMAVTSDWDGDIYIPVNSAASESLEQSGLRLVIDNEGNVSAIVEAVATSGEIVQKSDGGDVEAETGAAVSVASDVVIAGMTLIESDITAVLIENLWLWRGLIYNWRGQGSVDSPQDIWRSESRQAPCASSACGETSLTIKNSADVTSTTIANASSGGVEQSVAGGKVNAETGTARAIASGTTIVNTTLVNSSFRLLNLLLAAEWSGNLIFVYPEESVEIEPSPTPRVVPEEPVPTATSQPNGGTEVPELRLSATHNAEHGIYAGDGVTYDVEIYNNGPIAAQNVYLLQDFYDPEGQTVSRMKARVGEIGLNKRRTVHFVLKTGVGASQGEYHTVTVAEGESETGAHTSSNSVNQQFKILQRIIIPQSVLGTSGEVIEVVELPEAVLGTQTTRACLQCLYLPWYIAIWIGSLLYYGVCIKRVDWKRVVRYGYALPLTAYAGLWYSNPSCRSGLGMLDTNPWCEWFLIVAIGIYYLSGVLVKSGRILITRMSRQ